MYICYRVLNINTGKAYIGITKHSLLHRWRVHCDRARLKSRTLLHRSIAKHGKEAFILQVLHEGISKDDIGSVEQQMINEYNTHFATGYGYNMTLGGEGTHGRIVTEEMRRKMSESKIGRKRSEWEIQRIREGRRQHTQPNHTTPHSEETKQRLREVNLGKQLSDETKAKMSASRKGKPISPEAKAKRIGRRMSEETKQKISQARRNKKED